MLIKIIRTTTIPISLAILLKGQLKYLSNFYEVIALSSPGEYLEKIKIQEGVKVVSVSMKRNISIFHDFISLFKFFIIFKKEKPQIVHSITPKAGFLSMCAAYLASIPIRIHTFTGLIFPSKQGFLKNILIMADKILCKCATNIYAEGQGVRDDLLKYNITKKYIKIIGNGNINGIDPDYYNASNYTEKHKNILKKKYNISAKDFIFVYVGRLVKDKGINELVSAFLLITKKYPQCKLLLVGPYEKEFDPLLPEIETEIRTNQKIIATGFKNDVRPYLAVSNVFVFPSYREGFPNSVLQAAAMGLPSIVSNINGCNEIIINNFNGLIIPPRNINRLVEKMILLIENDSLRNNLSANARESIITRYDQNTLWKLIKEEYDNLIKTTLNN